MIIEYIDKAMHKAEYELIEDGTYYGRIPGFPGVWGNALNLEECRNDLQGALEGWLILKLWDNDDDIPVLGKLNLKPGRRLKTKALHEPIASSRARKAS